MKKNLSKHSFIKYKELRKTLLIMKSSLLIFLMTIIHVSAFALTQNQVSGVVTDSETGETIPGVSVVIQGTTIGTITSIDGVYMLSDVPDDAVLVFSYVGMTTRQIPVEGRTEINVNLEPDLIGIEEVVAIGYGTMRKSHLTGSVGSVQMDESLASRPVSDFGSAMYGKIAGVQVQSPTGRPGQSARIQVRGITSLSADVMPLVVVDGIIMPGYDLSTINASDIESIEVLKDAASAAIYGSRGSNGVILVNTRHGDAQAPRVTFNYTYGIQEQMRYVDMMNGPQYAQAAIDNAQNGWIDSGGDPNAPNTIEARGEYKYTWPEALENPETLWDTDFQRLISRAAPMHKADLSISGGSEDTRYMLSGGFLDQQGIIISSDFQRVNLNLKADSKISNRLTVGGMANASQSSENVIQGSTIDASSQMPSIYPVYGNDGYLGGPMSVDGFENHYNILMRADNQGHPLWHINGFDDIRHNFNLISSIFAEIEILPDLSFRSSFNSAYRRGDRRRYEKNDRGVVAQRRAIARSDMNRTMNYTSENLLTYAANWNDHQINAVAGYEYNHREYYNLHGDRRDFDNDLILYLTGGNTIQNTTDGASTSKLISVFSRLTYDYLGKYMASATIRQDGSSRFGPATKWGSFPSFSAGWRISEEEFMHDLDFMSNLTLRASLGFTGNEGIGNYGWIASMNKTNVAIGDNLSSSYYPSGIQNDALAWERSKQLNLGFDMGIFDGRVSLAADFYKTESDGLLLNVPIPLTSGFSTLLRNIGALETNGMEFNITSYNIRSADFTWSSQASFSRSRSIITQMGPDDAPLIMHTSRMPVINMVGETPFSFYAYKYDGVYMNQAEIDAHDVVYDFDVKPGMGRYVDVNGDGIINADDRTIIGNPEPDFIWAFGNNFTYKNIDMSFQIHGAVGGHIYNGRTRRSMFNHEGRNYFAVLADNAWRSEEEPGDGYHYKLSVDIPGFEKQASSYWLTEAGYVRLRDVTLGYTLPDNVAQRVGVASLRVYFNGVNLLDWQDGEYITDPENSHSVTDPSRIGWNDNPYPTARTYSFGLNINF